MYHIIVNSVSRKKRAQKNLKVFLAAAEERGRECAVHYTRCAGGGKELAEKITAENPAAEIVVVGGDGTLHEVLNGLADPAACRIGLIPSGTGNDFAAVAGIPLDAAEASRLVLDGEAKETDYLDVGGVRCMNVGGMGMDVEVLVRCRRGLIKGKIKYLLSLLQCLFAFKGYSLTVESEGRKEPHSALIAVACDGRRIGGGIPICPASVIDDGKMDVVTVECLSKWQIVKAFGKLMKGKVLEYPAAKHFLCERVKITPAIPCTVQLDGELYNGLDFDVTIGRGLKIYRP